ncbi:DUF4435 domain-containing protein [Vibrio vulnificus]|uniref:DUF4435 domain-containing protein n=1 Tax=Vibrio TaxID=662 RepID=UPI000CD0A7C7|nr:DUF4435 domain-containing protein [Vibrio cholerae]POB95535.1 hypothetical protein CRN41_16480 [Vibrio vulnificus]TXZ04101.1 DUF4435 domain-containing protein [Vibrio cholerae]GHY24056.1 hypothetical protein VCSRO69_3561 [Vibrio cholerae]
MNSNIELYVEEVITEISMSKITNPFLVVEGESDELFFLTKSLKNDPEIRTASGWEGVVKVIKTLEEEKNSHNVIGFIDRDYRNELGISVFETKIINTDYRDLEISMIESTAFKKVVSELCSKEKTPKSNKDKIDFFKIKENIYNLSKMIGKVRYVSQKEGYNFSFKKLKYEKFINSKTLTLDFKEMMIHICNLNNTKVDDNIVRFFKEYEIPESLEDTKFICSGHDFMSILGLSMKSKFGTNNSNDVVREKLESSFRIGYTDSEFYDTSMYKNLESVL